MWINAAVCQTLNIYGVWTFHNLCNNTVYIQGPSGSAGTDTGAVKKKLCLTYERRKFGTLEPDF